MYRAVTFSSAALHCPLFAAQKPLGEKPNILLILADGLPSWILGLLRQPGGAHPPNRPAGADRHPLPQPLRLRPRCRQGPRHPPHRPHHHAAQGRLPGRRWTTCWAASATSARQRGRCRSARFLDAQSAAKPFFLTASFTPYATLPDPGAYAQAKLDTFAQEGAASNAARGKDMLGANLLTNLRRVAAATTALDSEIGALIAKVAQKKLLDNTLSSSPRLPARSSGATGCGARAMRPTRSTCTKKSSPPRCSGVGPVTSCRRHASGDGQRLRPGSHHLRYHPRRTARAQSLRTQLSRAGQRQAAAQKAAVADHGIRPVSAIPRWRATIATS